MEVSTVVFILLIHFLGDFGLQTHQQATLKGTSNKFLFFHVAVYSLVWWIALLSYGYAGLEVILFVVITFVSHFMTDYLTSRIGKPFWENNDFHNGFVVVGFDQILHYVQLLYCWFFIFQE